MPTVLVTGASTGIGEACVLRLDQLGWQVFAGVRKAEDGERLRATTSERMRWLELDVTRPDQIACSAGLVGRGLDGLVNNAGIAIGGPLEYVPVELLRQQFEVNVFGLLAVTQAMLPALRQAKGRIVNIGSIAGRAVTPFVGPYCASKYAVEALTDGLRLELANAGIQVAVVEPGAIKTPIWEKGASQLEAARRDFPPAALQRYEAELAFFGKLLAANAKRGVPPSAVADCVVAALVAKRPKTRYVVGTDAKMRALFGRLLPDRANDAILRFFLRRLERRIS
jgi:NAD(P)-dependent dehydrogenase (short-subunit alcohol dehydrogenase family)